MVRSGAADDEGEDGVTMVAATIDR